MSGSSERMSMEFACNMGFFYFICICLFSFAVGYQGIFTQSGVEIKKMGHLQMKNLALSEVTNEMDKLNRFVSVIKKKSEGGLKRTCTTCSAVDEFSPGHFFLWMPAQVGPVQLGRSAGTCYGRYDIFPTPGPGPYATVVHSAIL